MVRNTFSFAGTLVHYLSVAAAALAAAFAFAFVCVSSERSAISSHVIADRSCISRWRGNLVSSAARRSAAALER
jgi:hypothetical protein